MRELIGKVSKHRGVIEEVYTTEHVRCQHCQVTVPMGIEVITDDLRREAIEIRKERLHRALRHHRAAVQFNEHQRQGTSANMVRVRIRPSISALLVDVRVPQPLAGLKGASICSPQTRHE